MKNKQNKLVSTCVNTVIECILKLLSICNKGNMFLEQQPCVVYFDLTLGATHSKHWSKYVFSFFFTPKSYIMEEKVRKLGQNLAKWCVLSLPPNTGLRFYYPIGMLNLNLTNGEENQACLGPAHNFSVTNIFALETFVRIIFGSLKIFSCNY